MTETIAVIICTKDRPADVLRAVRSLLDDSAAAFAVVVVDQSAGDETGTALRALHDERFQYIRSRAMGKGAALNEGLARTQSTFIACTDDDCEVTQGWVGRIVRPMMERPRLALVFSRVEAPNHDRALGYIPTFLPTHDRLVTRPLGLCGGFGLGAGMALRRDVVLDVGGFDEAFGPGGLFRSGDDFDLELRFLLKGWHVFESADAGVIHHGFRTRAEGRAHTVRDWTALGASCAKAVRAGHPVALVIAASLLATRALWPSIRAIATLQRPPLRRVLAFASGFFHGLRRTVDRHRLLYV